MSNKDNIYFSREEYNKLMQIIIDNKNSKDEEIRHRAEQLNEKFEKYIYLYEKQTEGKLEEGVIFIAYSNELKWIVQECMYLIKKKPKKDYYEELKIKENKGVNNELPRTKIDEKTGIEYHLEGDYYIPNLTIPKQEKIILNKYGRMRLNYLKEHKKAEYSTMLMDGTLNSHLKEIQETATERVEQIIKQLKAKSNLTEDMKNTDMLYWVGMMNNFKNQAEEIIFNELIYV